MIKTKEKLYFAYGSNMNLNQMAFRCPDAEVVESVRLEGYRLAFRTNGRAGMALPPFCRKKEAMWTASFGVFPNGTNSIWTLRRISLFIWEEPVTVTNQDGVRREIMAYTMNSPYKDKPAMPSVSYLEGILNGCRQNGIDTQTVIEAVRCTQQELPQKVVPHKKQRHPKHKEER